MAKKKEEEEVNMTGSLSHSRRQLLVAIGGAAAGLGFRGAMSAAGEPPRQGGPEKEARQQAGAGADLGSLFPAVGTLAEYQPFAHSYLGHRFRSLGEFRATGREKILELLHYRPEQVDPRPEVLERVDCGEYVCEKIVFSTSPLFRVPAYVLIPKGARLPAPAIVDLHSHGGMFLFGKEKVVDLGDNHPVMVEYHQQNYDGRPTASELARRGYVVMTIDAFFFGERRLMLEADLRYGWDRSKYSVEDARYLNQKCRAKESTLVKALALAGMTWPGVVFWDDIRALDYLVTRPEVDAGRVGCVGISMGGYRALFLAGLDDRIRAACVVGFMSTVRPMIRAHVDTHSNVHFLPGLHCYLDWPDVVSLHAPGPLLVQQCARDALFPLAGMRESVAKIASVYEKAGAREQFSGRFYDVPHRFTREMQDEAFEWFDRHLKQA